MSAPHRRADQHDLDPADAEHQLGNPRSQHGGDQDADGRLRY